MSNPFGRVPVLYRSWLYDPYEGFLVSQIRLGRCRSELFDFNSLLLPYSGRIYADADLAAFGTAIISPVAEVEPSVTAKGPQRRPPLSPEVKAAHFAAMKAKEARDKSERAARAEKDRVEREWAGRAAAKAEEKARAAREWDEAERNAKIRQAFAPLARASEAAKRAVVTEEMERRAVDRAAAARKYEETRARSIKIDAAQDAMDVMRHGRLVEGMDMMAKAGWKWLVCGYASKSFARSVHGCDEGDLMGAYVSDDDGEKARDVERWRMRGEQVKRIEITDLASRQTEMIRGSKC
jgi:hypothetical protein